LERHGQQLQQPVELVLELEPLGQQQMEMNLELEPRGQQLQQPVGLVFESLGQRVLALDLQLLEQQVSALPVATGTLRASAALALTSSASGFVVAEWHVVALFCVGLRA
jgi:hypothetical protein